MVMEELRQPHWVQVAVLQLGLVMREELELLLSLSTRKEIVLIFIQDLHKEEEVVSFKIELLWQIIQVK